MNTVRITEENLNKVTRSSIILGIPKVSGLSHVVMNCDIGFIFFIEESVMNSFVTDLTTADIIEDILRTMNNYEYYFLKEK
jgi:mannose/fructose/N-acetylgalactosamine-specific phosphotransferase system component IID